MLIEVKKCAEKKDIKGLRYIFVDCLDVDPTFAKYKEEYDYCKKVDGFLDPFVELTPLIPSNSQWNRQYWEQLKIDLMKNFSSKRFEHMVDVAKIIYANKISKLIAERSVDTNPVISDEVKSKVVDLAKEQTIGGSGQNEKKKSKTQQEEERIQARREEFARKNSNEKQLTVERERPSKQKEPTNSNDAKKTMGFELTVLVLGIAVIAIVIAIVVLQ